MAFLDMPNNVAVLHLAWAFHGWKRIHITANSSACIRLYMLVSLPHCHFGRRQRYFQMTIYTFPASPMVALHGVSYLSPTRHTERVVARHHKNMPCTTVPKKKKLPCDSCWFRWVNRQAPSLKWTCFNLSCDNVRMRSIFQKNTCIALYHCIALSIQMAGKSSTITPSLQLRLKTYGRPATRHASRRAQAKGWGPADDARHAPFRTCTWLSPLPAHGAVWSVSSCVPFNSGPTCTFGLFKCFCKHAIACAYGIM